MLCPALLMAWLATMPKQLSTFSEWALTTLVPAVFLLLEACNAPNPGPAQLGACLALVHGLGQGQPGKRPRSVWSIRQVGGGNLLAQACNTACTHASTHVHTAYMHSLHTACTHASTHVHTAYMHSSHTACTELMCTWLAQGWLPACPASSTKCSNMLSPLAAACTSSALSAAFLLPLCVRCCTGTCCCTFDCEERGGNPSPLFCFAIFIANIITMKEVRLNPKFVIWGC